LAEPKEISKTINLNLSKVPDNLHDTVKREVGEFVVNEIMLATAAGKSPVEGEKFDALSKDYATKEKGGNRTPNLRLDGDLMDDLTFEDGGSNTVKVGHFGGDQMGKADGHNKWNRANNNKIPKRRYIPRKSQKFNQRIENGIKDIVKEYSVDDTATFDPRVSVFGRPRASETIQETTQVQIDDVLSDAFIDEFLGGFFDN
jgi:hypothetical protein